MVLKKYKPHFVSGNYLKYVRQRLKEPSIEQKEIDEILIKAVELRNLLVIRAVFSKGIISTHVNNKRKLLVQLAFESDFLKAIDLVFSYCGTRINYADCNNFTHFHVACATGKSKIVEEFIQNGVDVNIRFKSVHYDKCNDFTPLHFAVKYGKENVVLLLLRSNAKMDATDFLERNVLHLVCGITDVIGDYIYCNAKPEADPQLSCYLNNTINILDLVLYDKTMYAKDNNGDTPLMHIFRDDTLKYIHEKFAQDSCSSNSYYRSFIKKKYAILNQLRNKQKKKLMVLLQYDPDVSVENNDGETVLLRAIKSLIPSRDPGELGKPYFNDKIYAEMVKSLLQRGADVNKKNEYGEYPLQVAVSLLSADIVKILLKYEANFSTIKFGEFYYSKTLPCFEAVENLIQIIEIFTENGYDFNSNDKITIMKFFISNNTDYNDTDYDALYFKLENLLAYGTDGNIKNTLSNRIFLHVDNFIHDRWKSYVIEVINKYLGKIDICNLVISDTLKKYLDQSRYLPDSVTKKYKKEYHKLVSGKNKWILDAISTPFHKLPLHLKYIKYSKRLRSSEFSNDFCEIGDILKGYFSRYLIRKFILPLATNFMRCISELHTPIGLPELCCEKILFYCSNEDILSLCIAIGREVNKKVIKQVNE